MFRLVIIFLFISIPVSGQNIELKKLNQDEEIGFHLKKIPLIPFGTVTSIHFSIPDTSDIEILFTDESEQDTLLAKSYDKLTPGNYSYNWGNQEFDFVKFSKVILKAISTEKYSQSYFISKYNPKSIPVE